MSSACHTFHTFSLTMPHHPSPFSVLGVECMAMAVDSVVLHSHQQPAGRSGARENVCKTGLDSSTNERTEHNNPAMPTQHKTTEYKGGK